MPTLGRSLIDDTTIEEASAATNAGAPSAAVAAEVITSSFWDTVDESNVATRDEVGAPETSPPAQNDDTTTAAPNANNNNPNNMQQQQQQQPSPMPYETTRVDGKGLWRSWKRNFKNKLLALLDLIDNSLDAAIADKNDTSTNDEGIDSDGEGGESFIGRVHIYPDEIPTEDDTPRNNGGTTSRYFNGEQPDMVTSNTDTTNNTAAAAASNTADSAVNNNSSNNSSKPKTKGLCIINNSVKPVRPLVQVLEVYNSSKVHSGSGQVGENGVGLKQGCKFHIVIL